MPLEARPGGCQESALGLPGYIPCNKSAKYVVGWKNRPDDPIRMCEACADHNVKNRGGEILRPFVADEPAPSGHNNPPPDAQAVTDQMALDYAHLMASTAVLLGRARELPEEVGDEATHGAFGRVLVDLRDAIAGAESHRTKEKEPYLRAGQAVDGFFKGVTDRLAKARDVIKRRDDDYVSRKVAAERAERQRALDEARRKEEAERRRAAEEAQKAEEARLAAERARKPETIEAKTEVAQAAEATADKARVDAMMAQEETDRAAIEASRKAADLARTRFDDGRLSTAKQVPYVAIEDSALLDIAKLWPFITDEVKLKALKAWARTTSHKQPMAGAVIEMRTEGVWR